MAKFDLQAGVSCFLPNHPAVVLHQSLRLLLPWLLSVLMGLSLSAGAGSAAAAVWSDAVLAILAQRATERGLDQAEVVLAADLKRLDVALCLAGERPGQLRAGDRNGRRYLRHAHWYPPGAWQPRDLPLSGRRLPLPNGVGGCVSYQVDLAEARRRSGTGNYGVQRSGQDLVASPYYWLWRGNRHKRALELRFDLPEGRHASVPWPELAGQPGWYLVPAGVTGWRPAVAFSRFPVERLPVGDTVLRLMILDGREPLDRTAMRQWLQACAEQLLQVQGRFPVPAPQVMVVPVDSRSGQPWRGGDPVPYARVLRDGGPAVQFFVDPRAPLSVLLQDWTGPHEFSHLLLPYVDRKDAWLSEGLASYYQYLLQARAGVLSEQVAWQRLLAGIRRGEGPGSYAETLTESIRHGGANVTMRLYWSGAALALMADVDLRRRSTGRVSLDTVLADLQACCLEGMDRTWEGYALFEKLDQLAGMDVFVPLYRRWVHSRDFPDYRPTLEALGIRDSSTGLRFTGAGEVAIRTAIMAPKAPTPDQRHPRTDA